MDGYEYDNEDEGMRDALERERERSAPDLAAQLAALDKTWGEDKPESVTKLPEMDFTEPPSDAPQLRLRKAFEEAGKAPEEEPSPLTGDAKPTEPPKPPDEPWARLKYDLEQNANRKPAGDTELVAKMKSVGWEPRASSSKEPDWERLQSDLEHAGQTARMDRLSANYLANVARSGNYDAGPQTSAAEEAALKAPLEIAKARQDYQHQQAATAYTQASTLAKLRGADADTSSLTDLRKAEADKWRNDDARARDAATAKQALDAEKTAGAASLREADTRSLGSAKSLWLKTSPYAQQNGLTAADLDGVTSRKDWEDFLHGTQTNTGKAQKPSAGPAPVIRKGDLTSIPDAGDRAIVAGMLNNTIGPGSVSRKDATRLLKYATQVNPDFDATAFATYAGVKKKLAESGDVNALNAAYNHLGRTAKNVPENFDAQALNRVRQAYLTGSGADTLTPFEVDVKVAADELAKAYGNNSEAGRQAVEHLLDPKQSPTQLRAALGEARELLGGKLDAYQHQLDAVSPKGGRRYNIRPAETVKLKFPNGKVLDVPASEVDPVFRTTPSFGN